MDWAVTQEVEDVGNGLYPKQRDRDLGVCRGEHGIGDPLELGGRETAA